ncbi:MAG: Holliday junction resolvase RuvX [Anaerolineales bacterium]|nr:MAG: Holliday junction resolvase RuvX [Anaerolineales bacterium]
MSRILAVDPGDVRIGTALSDPSGTIARPLETIIHSSRQQDAEKILELAMEHGVETIVVGVPFDDEGQIGPQARKAMRLVDVLRVSGVIPVTTWDESGSTQAALGGRRSDSNLDARAAAVILQEYLDAQST